MLKFSKLLVVFVVTVVLPRVIYRFIIIIFVHFRTFHKSVLLVSYEAQRALPSMREDDRKCAGPGFCP